MIEKKLLAYWKTCLAQAMKANIDVEVNEKLRFFADVWRLGMIDEQVCETFFQEQEKKRNYEKGIRSDKDPKWERPEALQLLVSPSYLEPQREEHLFFTPKPIYPFWFPILLHRGGHFSIVDEYFPVVPREWMSPVGNEDTDFVFCQLDSLEELLSKDRNTFLRWENYVEYLEESFLLLRGQAMEEFSEDDYRVVYETTIVVPEKDMQAGAAIVSLYEHLENAKQLPSLLKDMIGLKEQKNFTSPVVVSQWLETHLQHLGQMGGAFPLSISQRNALATLSQERKSRVFAVNGPPGTGKTTLIQSIVANQVVQTAIQGQDPAILLACSANNQAVLNIIESFKPVRSERFQDLQERWLPDFEGYATYLPARNKTEKELVNINYMKLDDSGLFARLEEETYVEKAERYFLNMVERYTHKRTDDISEAYFWLQTEIKSLQKSLEEGRILWKIVCEKMAEFTQRSIDPKHWTDLEENQDYWLAIESSIEDQLYHIQATARPMIRQTVLNLEPLKDTSRSRLKSFFETKLKLIQEVIKAWAVWEKWKRQYGIFSNPCTDEEKVWEKDFLKLRQFHPRNQYFFDEVDTQIRYKAFLSATHYWEGRWLEAITDQLKNETPNKGLAGRKLMWRTRAMLTPCFVSTFFMAPRFFSYLKFAGENEDGTKKWETPPMLEFVDFLIVDEAGQVSPEVGLASFGLAKQAVIVGDIQQIEPVWNTIFKIDLGNLLKNELIENEQDTFLSKLQERGFTASSGSIMKMALEATDVFDPISAQKGIMLLEHRRCHPAIISYCNDLAYKGLLKPMKLSDASQQIFPPMVLLDQPSSSTVRNKERFNEEEADEICRWLLTNKSTIERHYTEKAKQYKRIEELVGIITPFRGQRKILYKKLKKIGIDTHLMKIGTVHALQGAEREIIVFSPVYAQDDAEVFFFDRKNRPNMLNVAVSRAKSSFVVIGNAGVFQKNPTSPSGKLYQYLSKI